MTVPIYTLRHKILGKQFTRSPNYPDFRMVELYTCESMLRIVIATTAFSMGIDCTDIRKVISRKL